MRRCCFLSIENSEGWGIYDDLLVEPLAKKGWHVDSRVPWRLYETIDWSRYEVVVIRSTWDYQGAPDLFLEAMRTIANTSNVILANSLETVEWNISKRYLRDLRSKGVNIIPSLFIDWDNKEGDSAESSEDDGGGESPSHLLPVRSVLLQADDFWGRRGRRDITDSRQLLVIKPLISATSFNTFKFKCTSLFDVHLNEEDEMERELKRDTPDLLQPPSKPEETLMEYLERVFARTPAIVQPFVESVVEQGEFSLFFFGDKLSHAILKKPKPGDFRVQEEYGALHSNVEVSDLDPRLVEAAAAAQRAVPGTELPLYSRADYVQLEDGTYAMMELEAIEPSLYFNMEPRAIDNFIAEFCGRYGVGPANHHGAVTSIAPSTGAGSSMYPPSESGGAQREAVHQVPQHQLQSQALETYSDDEGGAEMQ